MVIEIRQILYGSNKVGKKNDIIDKMIKLELPIQKPVEMSWPMWPLIRPLPAKHRDTDMSQT